MKIYTQIQYKPTHSFYMSHLDQPSTDQNASTDNSKDAKVEETKQEFAEDEVELIVRMHNLIGNRWSLIAGRIPGRSAEEIEKYWTSKHYSQNNQNNQNP